MSGWLDRSESRFPIPAIPTGYHGEQRQACSQLLAERVFVEGCRFLRRELEMPRLGRAKSPEKMMPAELFAPD